ncbi:MAG: serine/threonine protein phosphatase [Gemmatimonadaceae bacterium]|nr:serine/threonine protein phosphatase [Chitinophagaceae bacterium]
MERTIVFGDIHGALQAFEQLIAQIGLAPEDKLIFLGDYVDGWSESAGVVERLMKLEATNDCIFLKGNHDAWCEEWMNGLKADEEWLYHGGKSTVESYAKYSPEKRAVHRAFFNRLKNFYIDGKNRLFVHAGFSSMHGPAKERYETNYMWDRTLWEMALAMDPKVKQDSALYPKRLSLYHEIYIGHTPTTNYGIGIPMQAVNVWNIDTGAAFLGKLTAMDIDTKNFWQSECVQSIYKNEKGRNR